MDMKQNHNLGHEVYRDILNQLSASICITEAETDKIVYMNQYMKRLVQLDHPVGMLCEQVIVEDEEGRCTFGSKKADTPLNCTYQVYKDPIEYGGMKYLLWHFADVTELSLLTEEAQIDDLTGIYNRRAGKEKLLQLMNRGRQEKKELTVVLYDINELKNVNDKFGHGEGDRLLCYISEVVRESLNGEEFVFRLGGDEFVIALYDKDVLRTEKQMEEIRRRLEENMDENRIVSGEAFFSYGITEVFPEEACTLADVIARADEKMYVQKRAFHINRAKHLLESGISAGNHVPFEFDKDHLYEALRDSTEDYIFVGNLKTGVFRYSISMVQEFGLPGEVVENAAAFWGKLIHPHDERGFLESNQEIADGRTDSHCIEYRARNVFGEWIWLRCSGHMIRNADGDPELFAGFISNLGKRDRTDHTTGLPGRFSFEGDIKKYLVEDTSKQRIGVMVLDLDSFKNINDLYDRSFGDEILRLMSRRIASVLPENARIYRLDGDEFGVVILNGEGREFEAIYQSIYSRFQSQQDYNGRKYYCTVSAGYAAYPEDADNYLDLVKYANYSLERSKALGKNRLTRFSQDILWEKENTLEMTELLRESIERGFAGFTIKYQPQVDAVSGELLGAEALARWQCSKFGTVSPGVFIPLLEQSGLILQVGKWICERAIEKCVEWSRRKPGFHMSINLSNCQLQDRGFAEDVKKMLSASGADPGCITLELTETFLIKADSVVGEQIEALRSLGLKLAMDDFGVGYSSLYSLKSIPVDLVKIDRGFVKDISVDKFNVAFIRSITELCHNVGRRVCLEGVETEEQYSAVYDAGLDMIQGFYFGFPEEENEFARKWLEGSL